MADYFQRLRPRYRTAILSNAAAGGRREEERRYGFATMADVLVYSYEVGIEKPDRRIYKITCQRLGVARARWCSWTTLRPMWWPPGARDAGGTVPEHCPGDHRRRGMPCGVRKLSPCNPTPDPDRAEVLLVGVAVAQQARPQLLGHRIGRCRPWPSSSATGADHDHHPAALAQRLRCVLGLVAPHDHGEQRRSCSRGPLTAHPEHGPGDATLG